MSHLLMPSCSGSMSGQEPYTKQSGNGQLAKSWTLRRLSCLLLCNAFCWRRFHLLTTADSSSWTQLLTYQSKSRRRKRGSELFLFLKNQIVLNLLEWPVAFSFNHFPQMRRSCVDAKQSNMAARFPLLSFYPLVQQLIMWPLFKGSCKNITIPLFGHNRVFLIFFETMNTHLTYSLAL